MGLLSYNTYMKLTKGNYYAYSASQLERVAEITDYGTVRMESGLELTASQIDPMLLLKNWGWNDETKENVYLGDR